MACKDTAQIVDLTAQNIVNAATKSKQDAERELKKIFAQSGASYAVRLALGLECTDRYCSW